MNRVRVSTTSVLLASFVAACGSTTVTNPETSKQGGSGGGSAAQTGGTNAGSQGGSNAGTLGGTSADSAGGSQTGPAGGSNAGNTGGSNAGNTGGSNAGNTGGTNAGNTGGKTGTGGSQTGGTSGSSTTTTSEPKLITSAPNAYWKEGTLTEVTSGTADVTVNDSALNNWDGFGGTFNEAGWYYLSMLDATDRVRAMKLLFDSKEGAGFAYGRVPIGATDYAMDRYTLDETANDHTMDSFSIERDRLKLIPYIKAALAVRSDIHLWASPWTPPTWMKDNSAMDGGNMKDDAKILQAYALYLAKFVEEYAKEGLKIEAVHPQNEPGYETRYPSCLWTAALFTKFIRDYLGPTFETRSVTADIYLGTMSNNDSGMDGTIISTVTGDSAAMKYVKGFGLQWNMLGSVSSLKSRNLPIIQTEHKCGNYPWNADTFNPNTAANDHAYAVESWGLILDWISRGVNSYSAWNMVLDTAGKNLDPQRPWPQNALLTVDTSTKQLNVTPAYYVFRHVSQYVDPGAKRVGTTGSFTNLLAFKNPDGSIVTVLFNSGSSAKKTILAVGSAKLQFDIPANGWATVNWQ